MARQQTDMCSKLVKESYKKAFQRNALHGTYELGRLAAELKVMSFWSLGLLTLEQFMVSGSNFFRLHIMKTKDKLQEWMEY